VKYFTFIKNCIQHFAAHRKLKDHTSKLAAIQQWRWHYSSKSFHIIFVSSTFFRDLYMWLI